MEFDNVFKVEFSELGVMRGFQKGITLGGRTSGSVNLVGLQNKVASVTRDVVRMSSRYELFIGLF